MRPNREQLAALLAVVDHGTFDAAAAQLHVTPSAVSQRIKTLESQLGQIVVVRANPVRPTDAGERLLRVARLMDLIENEAFGDRPDGELIDMPIGVNADSLATWFPATFSILAERQGLQLRLHVEDELHTTGLMQSAKVLAAVTSDRRPIQGCSIEALGSMRYLPVATPSLLRQHAAGRGVPWAALPVVRFNSKDDLQHRVLARYGVSDPRPCHVVPSSQAFARAVHAGLGWGALPEHDLGDALETGRLVRLGTRLHVDVPLYWQRWRLDSPALDAVTDAVRTAARSHLRRASRG